MCARCFTSARGARRACMLRAHAGCRAWAVARVLSPRLRAILRRSGCPPVARLERVSHTPTAHALLHCSRDVCGSVIASAHPGLAGPGSGTSSGGFAMALDGDEGDQHASSRVAVGDGRSSSAVAVASRSGPLTAAPHYPCRPLLAAGLSWPLSSLLAPRSCSLLRRESAFNCARGLQAWHAVVRCAGVRACGAASVRRRELRGRRHRRKTRRLEDGALPAARKPHLANLQSLTDKPAGGSTARSLRLAARNSHHQAANGSRRQKGPSVVGG